MRKIAHKLAPFLLLFMLATIMPPVTTGLAADPFSDVTQDSINVDAIQTLKDEGVIEGYGDGTYKPGQKINRAEFTKIVMGPIIEDMTQKNCFPDVKDEWFAPYVCEAKNLNVIEGYPDGEFKPGEQINFSEAAKIISNAYELAVEGSDAELWYKQYIDAMAEEKAVPLSVTFFDEEIDRGEMAEMIYRISEEVTTKATRTFEEINGEGFAAVDSCSELYERYQSVNNYYLYDYEDDFRTSDMVEESAAPSDAAEGAAEPTSAGAEMGSKQSGGGGEADDYSSTNIQVEGVDEADIIKNDGKYIYLIKGSTIRIVEAYPADNMKEIVSFTMGDENEGFYPSDLYVTEDQLVVLGSYYHYSEPVIIDSAETSSKMIAPPYYGGQRAKAYIVDISDREDPKVTRSVEFEGGISNSRRIGETLYLVLNKYNYAYQVLDSDQYTPEIKGEALLPRMMDTAVGEDESVAGCRDISILPKPDNFDIMIVAAVPLNDMNKKVDREVIVGSSENIYSSLNNLYVTATNWGGGYYRPYGDYGTAIYKFALDEGSVEYQTKGSVEGTVLNQFSMDQYNGNFRIATTKDAWAPGSEITNALYILDEDLKPLGSIENIAPGEKLYSARFMNGRAYLVTFKRVDPLFVIDVQDPKNPEILGELKIPGYSTYLHPYDENHLIGFGNEVDEEAANSDEDWLYYEAVQGMKVGIFDVTDVKNPVEMYKEVIGDRGTTSELLYNHKALLFDKEKDLLAFPVTVYEIPGTTECSSYTYSNCPADCGKICVPTSCEYTNGLTKCTADCDGEDSCVQTDFSYGEPVFDGAYVYDINLEDGLSLRGTISHYNDEDMQNLEDNKYTNYQKTIKRIIYIGENLYTISSDVIKANLLKDVSEVSEIELAGDSDYVYYPL